MFQNLEIFRTAQAMATHAAARQSVVAGNIANADTPGYKSKTLTSFTDTLEQRVSTTSLKTTRSRHIEADGGTMGMHIKTNTSAFAKPNGNTVSIEEEILQSIEAERQHSRALAVYQSSLNILKTSIGRGR